MKNTLIPFLVISLLLSATAGLALMSHMGDEGHTGCPFDKVVLANCSQVQNSLDSLALHISEFSKSFSAIQANAFVLFLVLSLSALAFIVFSKNAGILEFEPLFRGESLRESFVPIYQRQRMSWFALHENSPAFL